VPLNSRQKVILRFLLKRTEGAGHIALMKWLFLFSRENPSSISSYNFVPYKYGPFSFEAQQNITQTLTQYIEKSNNNYRLRDGVAGEVTVITNSLKASELQTLDRIWSEVHCLSREVLLARVYDEHPWYASRSELVNQVARPNEAELAVYTSGYEGKSVDAFLNNLLEQGIRGVLDVRRNAYSHKYGLSGPTLRSICNNLGMQYDHLPDLGVASELRKDLSGLDAYTRLFDEYEVNLPTQVDALLQAEEIIRRRPTSLMCFEAKSECCHRGRLAPKLASQVDLIVKHL